VVSRRDFLPFGEEIQSGTGGRNSAQGYFGVDSIRQKFTSYERDNETGLDFAQARMYQNKLGRFTSPDYFANDTHTSDPQSWNLYAYVRNNPLNRVDPLGKKAEVTSTYDEKTNTTKIRIRASFAIYGAAGQNVSKEDLERFRKALENGIKNAWNTKLTVDGQNYEIETKIEVQTANSEDEALKTGADNLVELGNQDLISSDKDDPRTAGATVFHREGENIDRMLVDIKSSFRSWEKVFAHEFIHLMGKRDRFEPGLTSTFHTSSAMSEQDFRIIFGHRVLDEPSPLIGGGYAPTNYVAPSKEWESKILGSRNSTFELRYSKAPEGVYWGRKVQK
jgi:RHS repeat-associated protein